VQVRLSLLLCALLCACATSRFQSEPPAFLFQDNSFAAPAERISASDVFALDDPMRHFLQTDIARQLRLRGELFGLVDALYRERQLKLNYDSSMTRNASEAFQAREGNCLSLVIMTAAFAMELGLQVDFHQAGTEEIWSRNGNLLLGSGHVNVTLGPKMAEVEHRVLQNPMTIDFLPPDERGGLRTREITQQTIVAMYMNNKSVEAMVRGQLDDAYGWARESIRTNPAFVNSYNTLGVIYLHHADPEQAARVFRYALERDPDNTVLMGNLADALEQAGNGSEAAELRSRLAQLDPNPPYYFFDLGMQAMQRSDFDTARQMFAREVARADYNHEFHFWLAAAYYKLGEVERARKQLVSAMERSPTRDDHNLYAAKLAWLKSNPHGGARAPAEIMAPGR
jgi:tetratricopeptide (TPR) repeat protein